MAHSIHAISYPTLQQGTTPPLRGEGNYQAFSTGEGQSWDVTPEPNPTPCLSPASCRQEGASEDPLLDALRSTYFRWLQGWDEKEYPETEIYHHLPHCAPG